MWSKRLDVALRATEGSKRRGHCPVCDATVLAQQNGLARWPQRGDAGQDTGVHLAGLWSLQWVGCQLRQPGNERLAAAAAGHGVRPAMGVRM